jgi:Protein of unknown function (DUF4054)
MNLCPIGPLPSLFTFYAGNGQFLNWFLQDPTTELPISNSVITATLYTGRDINNPEATPGAPVAGLTALSLAAVPGKPGKYQGLIPASFNPVLGSNFVLVVDAVTVGYQDLHWEIPAVVTVGTVQVMVRDFIVSPEQFRQDFREFADTAAYPDSDICFWMGVASLFLNRSRWCDALAIGAELYVAHSLVIEKQALDTSKVGGWPGMSKGVINSESPGAVTVSYDTAVTTEETAGHWGLTVYGNRFLRMARMFGIGPIQVGPECGYGPGALSAGFGTNAGGAWSGPISGNGGFF